MKKTIVISEKFTNKMNEFKVYDNIGLPDKHYRKGFIEKVEGNIYLLKDEGNTSVCGILDAVSFYDAIMDTQANDLFIGSLS